MPLSVFLAFLSLSNAHGWKSIASLFSPSANVSDNSNKNMYQSTCNSLPKPNCHHAKELSKAQQKEIKMKASLAAKRAKEKLADAASSKET